MNELDALLLTNSALRRAHIKQLVELQEEIESQYEEAPPAKQVELDAARQMLEDALQRVRVGDLWAGLDEGGEETSENLEKAEMPDAYSADVYDWVDNTLAKAGMTIGGDQPRGAKSVGRQLEADLYRGLNDRMDAYLTALSVDKPQHEIVNEVDDLVRQWQQQVSADLDKAFEELYQRGFMAGVLDTGVRPAEKTADRNALAFIRANPNRIGSRIKIFASGLVEKFRPIIAGAYTAEGTYSLRALYDQMKEVVPAERYKLERIVRTETASVSNNGRISAWEQDPYKYFWDYHWNASPDNRVKLISMWRMNHGPYTLDEIKFLWEHQGQVIAGKQWWDMYNQRCAVSRSPRDDEWKGNRFEGSQEFVYTG